MGEEEGEETFESRIGDEASMEKKKKGMTIQRHPHHVQGRRSKQGDR